ncbi:MAG: Lrp/AsnC family transcriptional regulator [Thermoplasmatota archaeon]|nr:Lrp/AsnC family transcriptional regulator [Halobacteriales archaeon]
MVRIDDTNLKLLQLLQRNGRMTMTELAGAVGRSESTVRERVTALELAGFLQGYQARVDWSAVGLPASAVIRARCDINRIPEVAKQLANIPHVTRAMLLTGPKPVMAILRVRDIQHLHSILRERLANGILSDIEAEVAMESLVETRPPAVGENIVAEGAPGNALGGPNLPAPPPPSFSVLPNPRQTP